MSRPLFHLIPIVLNSYTIWYDQMYIEIPCADIIIQQNFPLKNRPLFLTWWSLVLQTIYFAVALLNDLFGTNDNTTKRPLIRVVKDSLFSLAFPIALYVAVAFWSIYAVDKELILPEPAAKAIPPWANHVMHTLIAPFIIIELLSSNRIYPSRKVGITQALLFTNIYTVCLLIAYTVTGEWVYPVLEVMSWPFRIIFLSSSTVAGVGVYLVGEKVNSLVSSTLERTPEKKKQR